jgi:catalase
MANTKKDSIKSRQIAFLVADGVDGVSVQDMRQALEAKGAMVKTVAPKLGMVKAAGAEDFKADQSLLTSASVLFDAVFVPDGVAQKLNSDLNAKRFVKEAYRHCKALAGVGEGAALIQAVLDTLGEDVPTDGVILDDGVDGPLRDFAELFTDAIAAHRFWERESALGL